jgi:hypothetical protein
MSLRSWLTGLNEPRPSRGYVVRWSCPGDGCAGLFRSREQANDHGGIAAVTGSHDAGPQYRARRARGQALRQLRRQARRAARQR